MKIQQFFNIILTAVFVISGFLVLVPSSPIVGAIEYSQYCPSGNFFDSNCNTSNFIDDSFGCFFDSAKCSSGKLIEPAGFDILSTSTYSVYNPTYPFGIPSSCGFGVSSCDGLNCAGVYFGAASNCDGDPSKRNDRIKNCTDNNYGYFGYSGNGCTTVPRDCGSSEIYNSINNNFRQLVNGQIDSNTYNKVIDCLNTKPFLERETAKTYIPFSVSNSAFVTNYYSPNADGLFGDNNSGACNSVNLTQEVGVMSNNRMAKYDIEFDCNSRTISSSGEGSTSAPRISPSVSCSNQSIDPYCQITITYDVVKFDQVYPSLDILGFGSYGNRYYGVTTPISTCVKVLTGRSNPILQSCDYNSNNVFGSFGGFNNFNNFGNYSSNFNSFNTFNNFGF
jgi:hypothetical protein